MLIAIIGLNGSGKDMVANYIAEKYNFTHISLSNIVRVITKEEGLDPTKRDNLNFIADKKRKIVGPNFLVKKALKNYSKEKNFVLSSFRHPSEIDLVKEKGGKIIKIDVPLDVRFARTVKRKELNPKDHGSNSFEDFVLKEKRELESSDKDKMQILEVLKKSDFIINNNCSLKDLKERIDKLMNEIN